MLLPPTSIIRKFWSGRPSGAQKTSGSMWNFDSEVFFDAFLFRSEKNYTEKLYQEILRKYPILDPERYFIDPGKIMVFRMTEVGWHACSITGWVRDVYGWVPTSVSIQTHYNRSWCEGNVVNSVDEYAEGRCWVKKWRVALIVVPVLRPWKSCLSGINCSIYAL